MSPRRAQRDVVTIASEFLPVGVFLLDRQRQIVYMNLVGRYFADACAVDVSGRLPFLTADVETKLLRMKEDRAEARVRFVCGSESIEIAPVNAGLDIIRSTAGWISVCVTGPAIESFARRAYLRSVWGATRAEATIGDLLTNGKTTRDIASLFGRRRSTIVTHVKRLLQKTQTTNQRQFVALVSSVVLTVP